MNEFLFFPLQYTSISESDIQQLQDVYEDLLGKVRPNAVGLVDAFDFRDQVNFEQRNKNQSSASPAKDICRLLMTVQLFLILHLYTMYLLL